MSDAPTDLRATCSVAAAWLHAQRVVGHFALVLALLAGLVLLSGHASTLAALLASTVLVLAPVERYFALRLAFDRDLFDAWSRGTLDGDGIDTAFARLRLAAPPVQARPLDDRIAGASRLHRKHLAIALAQAALLGGALLDFVFATPAR